MGGVFPKTAMPCLILLQAARSVRACDQIRRGEAENTSRLFHKRSMKRVAMS